MTEILDVVAAKGAPGDGYEVECRGQVCRIVPDVEDRRKWLHALRAEAEELFATLVIRGDTPEMYVELDTAIQSADQLYIARLRNRVYTSPKILACQTDDAPVGVVRFWLQIEGPGEVRVLGDGDLLAHASGRCLREQLEIVVGAFPPPDDVSTLPSHEFRFQNR